MRLIAVCLKHKTFLSGNLFLNTNENGTYELDTSNMYCLSEYDPDEHCNEFWEVFWSS